MTRPLVTRCKRRRQSSESAGIPSVAAAVRPDEEVVDQAAATKHVTPRQAGIFATDRRPRSAGNERRIG
jgi:hypothetical protein